MRFTTRRLLLIVAVIAVGLTGLRTAARIIAEIGDSIGEPFAAGSQLNESWDLGPTPTVLIDCFEGNIQVTPATNGRVTARIMRGALAEDHRSAAEEAVRSIVVDCDAHDDTLRIVARGVSEPMVRKDVHVDLQVPSNVRLDLRTGRGIITVGWKNQSGPGARVPIVSPSIRARNDSRSRLGYAEGDIRIACQAPRAEHATATPTHLQLDAPGRIEVEADLATIEARAWPSVVPPGWTAESYESVAGGRVGTILA